MICIETLRAGAQTTFQDLGRPGYGHLGVSACGAADSLALRIGNLIAGNGENEAALEMTLLGARFRFSDAAVAVVAGAEFAVSIDGQPAPRWTPLLIEAGQVLTVDGARTGCRAYLCLHGGFEVPRLLGSRSTHVPSRMGGFDGRALISGDLLPAHGGVPNAPLPGPRIQTLMALRNRSPRLRIVDATQTRHFPAAERELLAATRWTVHNDSSRMGVRLTGTQLAAPAGGSMTTEGVPLGAIQVTPSGEPMILGVDHQTTGGYPKIGCVISADRWRVGQLRPRDEVRFEFVPLDEARRLLLEQEALLRPEVLLE